MGKMLEYYALLMQDAAELNFPTVKRAHAAVLQEIERGKVNWDQLDLIENKKKYAYTETSSKYGKWFYCSDM